LLLPAGSLGVFLRRLLIGVRVARVWVFLARREDVRVHPLKVRVRIQVG
jgi:hypothetical protein